MTGTLATENACPQPEAHRPHGRRARRRRGAGDRRVRAGHVDLRLGPQDLRRAVPRRLRHQRGQLRLRRPQPAAVATTSTSCRRWARRRGSASTTRSVDGKGRTVTVVDPATIGAVFDLNFVQGQISDLTPDGVLLSKSQAKSDGLTVGSPFAAHADRRHAQDPHRPGHLREGRPGREHHRRPRAVRRLQRGPVRLRRLHHEGRRGERGRRGEGHRGRGQAVPERRSCRAGPTTSTPRPRASSRWSTSSTCCSPSRSSSPPSAS